jgi:omega-6 fatty acid desaturase (delta-12 desaturase)
MTKPLQPDPFVWREVVAKYQRPHLSRSLGQIITTLIPYFALLYAMYLSLRISYAITLALTVPAAGFLVRCFVIMHDCGHGSFFQSKRANRIWGCVTGLLSFIPSYAWSHQHAKHHAAAGNLDNRGYGDVWTLTLQEYLALPGWQRMRYRVYRNPLVMFGFGPLYLFLIRYRFWRRQDNARVRWSTIRTNLMLLGIVLVMSLTIGLKAYLMIQLPVLLLAATAGVWLFYVQHQFDGTYWERREQWSFARQALEGSSFYKLPCVLQWFTGNIGFHHVHHLCPRMPNYHLSTCHESHALFTAVKPLTFRSSFQSLAYRLWDEEGKKLVSYRDIKSFLGKRAIAGGE